MDTYELPCTPNFRPVVRQCSIQDSEPPSFVAQPYACCAPVSAYSAIMPQHDRQRTRAMAAEVTSRRWTVHDILAVPLPPLPDRAPCM